MTTRRAIAAFTVVAALAAPLSAPAEIATAGKRPPLFSLPDETGTVHRLEDLLGQQPVMLYFTHNMCHYCTQIIAFLKRAHELHASRGLMILTINVLADNDKLIRRYKEQFGLPFPMLAGKNPRLLHDYEVNYVPIIVFIRKDGVISHIDHHYILPQDFDARVNEIVGD